MQKVKLWLFTAFKLNRKLADLAYKLSLAWTKQREHCEIDLAHAIHYLDDVKLDVKVVFYLGEHLLVSTGLVAAWEAGE